MRLRYVRGLLALSVLCTLLLAFFGFHEHQWNMQHFSRLVLPCRTCKYQSVYGNHTVITYKSQGDCKQQLLVLGLHNSGTSMVARLLTLLGIWVGEPKQLSIGKDNKLKWWERFDTMLTNDELTANHTNPSHPTWIGFGFDTKLVLPKERERFQIKAGAVLEDLKHFCPFMIKDPRLCYVGKMWMELMDKPVCILVYRHPARIALRLGMHWFKGDGAKLDPEAWLAVWEYMMTSALKTCRDKPVVLVQSVLAKPETLEQFYNIVIPQLEQVGISDIKRPTQEVLQEHFLQYYKQSHPMKTAELDKLSEECNYSEVKPSMIDTSTAGLMNFIELLRAWPDHCSIKAPDSTRALVMAFEKVLMQQYSASMKVAPRMLAQTVLKYQEDILYDMSMANSQT